MEIQRNQKQIHCPENEALASYMWNKRQEMTEAKGLSEHIDMTLYKAYCSVCSSKAPIKTLKEFSQIKGVGKWILRLMKGFFESDVVVSDVGTSEPEDLTQDGKKIKGTRRYVPQKNSAAYALLITLYRAQANGSEFMRKQELIDAAGESGLSRGPIAAEKGRGKANPFGGSPKEWYTGWNSMQTLIRKGLVVRSSNPAKYMLTQEGKEAACECLSRSGLVDGFPNKDDSTSDMGFPHSKSAAKEVQSLSVDLSSQKKSSDIPFELCDQELVCSTSIKVSEVAWKDTSSHPIALHHHREKVYPLHLEFKQNIGNGCLATSGQVDFVRRENNQRTFASAGAQCGSESSCSTESANYSFNLKACSSLEHPITKSKSEDFEASATTLAMPPLRFGERFGDVYDVVLILDDREQFTGHRSRCRKFVESLSTQFKIQVEVRRLPVGDAIWIARHKHLDTEYVLDFIVERKDVDDLRQSIRDNRYRDQKLRLLRCGLKKLIYLVEGDPNSSEAAESIKTACFTTEILEGFDVQRTSGLSDTVRKYGFLTQAITNYYGTEFSDDKVKNTICPSFDEFIKKCQNLDKMTVSDVFAVQLMQVPQVTEEVAVAVLDLYPTLLSLAQAYSHLDGDVSAQEEMLRKKSNNLINGLASRNIFRLVWGG
ncbi:PREDICTED: crossover junction endonuclease MUS81 isoform X2 [Nelumbo nucifera]|uniref:Crossover junction endonuclease MUS81 n=2 Tax=Nelumbo nucifera TaxID=4432 RepID=A0A822ZDH9_NELNU|nr:PREDICTED: crossover junction endonuclease MUS81 isoform X2 [Nelumbo nucifera]DAD42570.1 TPA_asm: hypothetical protein HUJ06_000800 [Nelumbo nucifera]